MSDDHFPTVRLARAPALPEQDRAADFSLDLLIHADPAALARA